MAKSRRRKRRPLGMTGKHQDMSGQPLPPTKTAEITLFAYGPGEVVEQKITDVADLRPHIGKWPVLWLDFDGDLDLATIYTYAELFQLHELALEDVITTRQRAKVEQYDEQLFIVMRMIDMYSDHPETEQLSLFLGKNFVLTFQERPGGDCLAPVRERLRKSLGQIRQSPADYLAYAIIDAVVDGYFPVLEVLGERLDVLEDDILDKPPSRQTPGRVHEIKRDILSIRRAIWPLRDAVNTLCRDVSPLVSEQTRIYMRDVHDHALRIMDLVEMYREIGSDLTDLHLTSVSNRMNEVMKMLTIITTLFIPPTFIAGVYGMNFDTKISPYNMPELNWYYGYPMALGTMALVTSVLTLYLVSRGWIGSREDNLSGVPPHDKKIEKV